jgi:chromosomal replication initiator protein
MQSNIRELEGALTRVLAYSDLRGLPLTVELVGSALGDFLPRDRKVLPNQILEAVSEVFEVDRGALLGRSRAREVALPRQIAMYLLRKEAKISLPQIGEALGGRDHTTVMYGCDKINDLLERDEQVRRRVAQVRERLFQKERG